MFSSGLRRSQWNRRLCKQTSSDFDHSVQSSSLTVSSNQSHSSFDVNASPLRLTPCHIKMASVRGSGPCAVGKRCEERDEDDGSPHLPCATARGVIGVNALRHLFKILEMTAPSR